MPWAAPIIGYSDNVGVLRCAACAPEEKRQYAVPGDSYFGTDDVCETCKRYFKHVKTSEYVHVSWGCQAPDIIF